VTFDIPCSLLVKRIGFWLVPVFVIAFGLVTIVRRSFADARWLADTLQGTAFIQNRAGWFIVRFLLGVGEAVIMPGNLYLLSRYYRRKELTARIGARELETNGLAS
jgi:MFS family permease